MPLAERIEGMLGFDPQDDFEALHARLEELHILQSDEARLVGELAPFKAEFYGGQASHSDIERKAVLAQVAVAIRREREALGLKVTEAQLDTEAHAHPTYLAWIEKTRERAREMGQIEAELAQVRAHIEAAEGAVKLAERRVRMNEEMMRVLRTEMGNIR